MLPSLLLLGTVAIAALVATRSRVPSRDPARLKGASVALALATLAQCAHFAEEATNEFHLRLPEVFGASAMPFTFFMMFNLACIGAWVLSIRGILGRNSAAFFASWFLGMAGVGNGLIHPLLAVQSGAYFPGLYTSPLVLAACAFLLIRLSRATVAGPAS